MHSISLTLRPPSFRTLVSPTVSQSDRSSDSQSVFPSKRLFERQSDLQSTVSVFRPSVRPPDCPSDRPSVRPSVRQPDRHFARLPIVRLTVSPTVRPAARLFVRPSDLAKVIGRVAIKRYYRFRIKRNLYLKKCITDKL